MMLRIIVTSCYSLYMTNNTDLTVGQIITRKTILGYSTGAILSTETVKVTRIDEKMAVGQIIASDDSGAVGRNAGVLLTAAARAEADAQMEARFAAEGGK